MNVEGSKKRKNLEKKKRKRNEISNAFNLCGKPSFFMRNHT